ncbi:hypothetical protein BASA81_008804 [Batrachochytrium salamandrivorans]|nr:hypothetical protein BASA81_008804 [Batrachochytrium salamandrivorans]
MADIPEAEKVAIATHYLMSSPPHEAREVLADVKIVLNPPSLLTDGVLRSIFRKYNLQNFETIEADGSSLLLNEYAELDAKHFTDGRGNVFQVEHVTQKATKVTDGPEFTPGPNEKTRLAIQTAVDEYCQVQFVDGCAVCSVLEREGGELYICLSGSKANLRNYWSGKWKSEWKLNLASSEISGKVRIVVHYFEDGNVQLDQNKDVIAKKLSAKESEPTALAQQVKEFIRQQEADIQDTLEEMYQNMGVETFKDMRRVLPISKTKMDWTGAQLKLSQMSGKGKN